MNPRTASVVRRIVDALGQTTIRPVVDGPEVRLGDRRIAVAVRDDTLTWEGQEHQDDSWWPAAGPHRIQRIDRPMDYEDAIDTLVAWLKANR